MARHEEVVVRSPRIAERRRMVRRERARRRRRIAVTAVVLAASGAGAWMMTGSSVFAIAALEVEGTSLVDEARVLDASGLRVGASALGADLTEAAERVRALTGVRDARVERDGVVVIIRVEERRPAVELRAGQQAWILDRDGDRLAVGNAHGRVPVVRVEHDGSGAPHLPAPVVEGIDAMWRGMTRGERVGLGFVEVQPDGTVSFLLRDVEVRFGAPVEVHEKLVALRAVRRQARRGPERLIAVDLSSPRRPAATLV